ncbi:Clan CA, family C19, ubiquitin hydrolase-like cysteine peptidase [Trichomonas vaginalis G3]|uniref:ubiquitinyl hydrolase 1 n=1 Tax=Trichomonas vaginalis (strain ATCC PRA-98 / G3) TaxID=412133 RepID=A2D750_TRIV3|nr:ubiquitinyl hydrolase protein [Trichomonas vaginalis G3]EAY23567.1 Clan CA, family C19, ubiquitin hydrolase-like cysteine peptidase [Trichomonas vaginalis G3]KAI5490065.1 ubiquitinyl hydrolase protein [Trichomonas vaginalis G3]|eukprot:XP_001276815.1 Clan CA, family C19, ubiquitin hydrolase-like cysteine peptidase [Trichomonas vaginalis G3]
MSCNHVIDDSKLAQRLYLSMTFTDAWKYILYPEQKVPKAIYICLTCNSIKIQESKMKKHNKKHNHDLFFEIISLSIYCCRCKNHFLSTKLLTNACLTAIPTNPMVELSTGFPNLGRSCYANASLIALSNVKPLTTAILESSYPACRLMATVIQGNRHVNKIFHSLLPEFSPTTCSDAGEFILALLELLFQDPNVKTLFGGRTTTFYSCADCKMCKTTSQPFSIFPIDINPQGWLNSDLETNRNHLPRSFGSQAIWNIDHEATTTSSFISVMMHGNSNSISLEKCIETMFSPSKMQCSECKSQNASITEALTSLPEILIVELKRFTMRWFGVGKIYNFIDFPIEGKIDFGHFVPPDIEAGPTKYKIRSIIAHKGNMSYGHYVAYCSTFEGWKLYDDSKVSIVDPQEVYSSNAYILIYSRALPEEVAVLHEQIRALSLPRGWGLPIRTISDPIKWIRIVPETPEGTVVLEVASSLAGGKITRPITKDDIIHQFKMLYPYSTSKIYISEEDYNAIWKFLYFNGELPDKIVPVEHSDFQIGDCLSILQFPK